MLLYIAPLMELYQNITINYHVITKKFLDIPDEFFEKSNSKIHKFKNTVLSVFFFGFFLQIIIINKENDEQKKSKNNSGRWN